MAPWSRSSKSSTPSVVDSDASLSSTMATSLSSSGSKPMSGAAVCAIVLVIGSYAFALIIGIVLGRSMNPSSSVPVHGGWQDSLKEGASDAWVVVSSVSNKVTEQSAKALEASAGALVSFLGLSKEALAALLTSVGNVGYCAVLTLGFVYLPPDVMLVVGLVTFLIGPALVLFALNLVGGVFSLAAATPAMYVLLLFVVAFMRSRLAQQIGNRLGLDVTGDGTVGWRDIVQAARDRDWVSYLKEAVARTGWLSYERLEELDRALVAPPPPAVSAEDVSRSLAMIESRLATIEARVTGEA